MSIHGRPDEQGHANPETPQPREAYGETRAEHAEYRYARYGQEGYGQRGQPQYGQAAHGQPHDGQPDYGRGGYRAGQYGAPGTGYPEPGTVPIGAYPGYGVPGPGYGGTGNPGGPAAPGQPGVPGQPGGGAGDGDRPRRHSRRLVAGLVATAVAFAGGAGATAWAVGVPGTSIGGALANKTLSTASIVQMTDPAVVDIVSTLGGQGAQSAGTGIVLSSTGEVLTNNHVIDGATSIRVTDVGNGHTYSAAVTGYDASHDVAVIKLKGASGLKTATLGESSTVGVGQKVVAVGNAGGRGGLPSVATGHVTGLNASITAVDQGSGSSERLTDMIRTNANIQAGDSGGPLLNTKGQVIGINTAAGSGNSTESTDGVQAFAIPITRALDTAKQIDSGTASDTVHIGPTAFLGVGISNQQGTPGESTGGAPVAGVVQGGPAAGAGITGGDVITSLDGKAVTSGTSLRDNLIAHHPGDTVRVTWQDQAGQTHSASVQLGTGPAA